MKLPWLQLSNIFLILLKSIKDKPCTCNANANECKIRQNPLEAKLMLNNQIHSFNSEGNLILYIKDRYDCLKINRLFNINLKQKSCLLMKILLPYVKGIYGFVSMYPIMPDDHD